MSWIPLTPTFTLNCHSINMPLSPDLKVTRRLSSVPESSDSIMISPCGSPVAWEPEKVYAPRMGFSENFSNRGPEVATVYTVTARVLGQLWAIASLGPQCGWIRYILFWVDVALRNLSLFCLLVSPDHLQHLGTRGGGALEFLAAIIPTKHFLT